MVNQNAGIAYGSENPRALTNGDEEWEPLFNVPDVLRRDGSNYVQWIWSLLDDGINARLVTKIHWLVAESRLTAEWPPPPRADL